MENVIFTLFFLLAVHALLDFPLQGDAVAINKNPNANTELQKHVPWYYWMGAHALIHGGGVALVTNSLWLGLAETTCHFLIDYGKCDKRYSIHGDQALHVLCKVVWVILWVLFK
jgi:hypothetical protein